MISKFKIVFDAIKNLLETEETPNYSAEQNQATYAKLNHTTNIPKSRSF